MRFLPNNFNIMWPTSVVLLVVMAKESLGIISDDGEFEGRTIICNWLSRTSL